MACSGNEAHLSACTMEFGKNASVPCAAGGPAAVSCVPGPQFTQGQRNKSKRNRTVSSNLLPLAEIVVLVGSNFTTLKAQHSENIWNRVCVISSLQCRRMY